MNQQTRFHYVMREAITLAALGAALLFVFINFGFGIPCIFRKVTGLLCPGCGMTHALSALVQGHIRKAIEYNVLSVSVLPVITMYLLYHKVRYIIQGGNFMRRPWEYIFLITALFITIGYCVLRNVNYF